MDSYWHCFWLSWSSKVESPRLCQYGNVSWGCWILWVWIEIRLNNSKIGCYRSSSFPKQKWSWNSLWWLKYICFSTYWWFIWLYCELSCHSNNDDGDQTESNVSVWEYSICLWSYHDNWPLRTSESTSTSVWRSPEVAIQRVCESRLTVADLEKEHMYAEKNEDLNYPQYIAAQRDVEDWARRGLMNRAVIVRSQYMNNCTWSLTEVWFHIILQF